MTQSAKDNLAFLNAVFEHAGALLLVLDRDGRFRSFNRACETLSGYSFAEVEGKTPWDTVLDPDEAAAVRSNTIESLANSATDTTGRYANHWIAKDGTRRLIEWTGTTLRDARGAVDFIVFSGTDITERKRIERDLRVKEAALDAALTGIAIADLQARLTYVNASFLRMWRCAEPREVLGRSALEFWRAPEHAAGVVAAIARDGGWTGTLEALRGDGTTFVAELSATFIRDADGNPTQLFASFVDVTARVEAEERYARVVESMTEGVVVQQDDGQIVACNAAAEEVLGLSTDQIRGRTALDPRWSAVREDGAPFPGDQHPGTVALRTGQTFTEVVMGVNHPRKGRRWISINAHPLMLPGRDRPAGSVASFTDITDRRRAEEALRAANQVVNSVLDTTPVMIAYLDPAMNFIRVNAAYAAADGRTPDFFPGKNHFALYPNDDNEAIFRRVAQTGVAHRAVAKPFEYAGDPQRGVTHWDWTLTPIKDAAGPVTGLVLSLLNVTDRVQALEQARRSEALLATMMENLQGLVYRCANDPDWTMLFMSAGSRHLTGYDPVDFVEHRRIHYADLIHPDDRAAVWNGVQAALARHEPFLLVYRIQARDGTCKWVWERGCGVFDAAGALLFLEGLIVDMTAQKTIEAELADHRANLEKMVQERTRELERAKQEAERANRAKSDFLSRMSHELRTPMNAILGFSQLLGMEELGAHQREHVAEIQRAGEHLLNLINELLDLSRIESGTIKTALQPVNLQSVLEEARQIVQPLIAERDILFRSACDERATVQSDPVRFRQVLVNLLSNAAKYNRAGGTIDVGCGAGNDHRLRITVTDTGAGIPADKLGLLFTPFERLGAEYGAVEGTGIGLALSRQLVELMGGSMGVTSVPGRGSTFWIEMPSATPAAAPPEPARVTSRISVASYTVLYIEDNAANLRLIEMILSRQSALRLISATRGDSGLDLARRERPDLILLDINLPGMNGYDVLGALQLDPATRAIPVIALSADAMPIDIERARRAGFADYVTKPVQVSRLLATLETVLASSRPPSHHPR